MEGQANGELILVSPFGLDGNTSSTGRAGEILIKRTIVRHTDEGIDEEEVAQVLICAPAVVQSRQWMSRVGRVRNALPLSATTAVTFVAAIVRAGESIAGIICALTALGTVARSTLGDPGPAKGA
ncbi:MAG: hypothetical protein HYX88_02275 [Chloroflexi bacterium]|nr:hypothetical protein [Chloroflexota bacterium]